MNLMWWYYFVWTWYEPKIKGHFKNRLFVINRKIELIGNVFTFINVSQIRKTKSSKIWLQRSELFSNLNDKSNQIHIIKKRCHMKLWVKYHFSSLRNSTTVVTLAFCILDRFFSILHNKISKDQTKLLNPLFILFFSRGTPADI